MCYTDSDEHTHDVASFRHQTIIIQGVLLLEYVYIHVQYACMWPCIFMSCIHVQYCYLYDSILSIVMDSWICVYIYMYTCKCVC